MTHRPAETHVPAGSRASALLPGADFHDAWCVESSATQESALDHLLRALQQTPRWVDACMQLRNRVGGWAGLKDLHQLSSIAPDKPAAAYQAGDRAGIFTVIENSFDEALVGDDDKHLRVVLSAHRGPVTPDGRMMLTVSTIVHVKNWLGRLYMLPVKPMHRLIAPTVLRALAAPRPASAAAPTPER